jgi:broad specificity phosphatase PhoE
MKRLNSLYFARHGQVAGHERLPANGHTDVDITEIGMLQMEHPAGRLRLIEINVIYSRNMLKEEDGKDILLVANGGVNRVILCNALGIELVNIFNIQQDYGCLNIIEYFPDHTLVRLING